MSLAETAILTPRDMLRRSVIKRREALSETDRHALTAQLSEHLATLLDRLSPKSLGFCWPYRAEPDLRDFVAHWLASQSERRAALPVVLDRDEPMMFRPWTPGMLLVPDRHGIPYPPGGCAMTPDVVLVPLNAFDAAGYRIGYGGGYFDRTLATLDTVAVGVGFELGRVACVAPQPHDRPMDWIVTEAGVAAPQPRIEKDCD